MSEQDWADKKAREVIIVATQQACAMHGSTVVLFESDNILENKIAIALRQEREATEAKWKKIEWPSVEEINNYVKNCHESHHYVPDAWEASEWVRLTVESRRK